MIGNFIKSNFTTKIIKKSYAKRSTKLDFLEYVGFFCNFVEYKKMINAELRNWFNLEQYIFFNKSL
jgi:hypothetical protein